MSKWSSAQLRDLVTFQKGKKVETSPYLLPGYHRYLGASSLSGNDGEYASTYLAVQANTDDVLMLWDGERSGLVGHGLEGVVSSTVSKLTPNGKIASNYLYYFLLNNFEWIQNRRTGTGIPHVSKDLGRILSIDFPTEKNYQRKVALVLETIDQNIGRTKALIEKYQQVKAGLMRDLFVRGIGDDGKLRPSREQGPELYQETDLGWLPLGWRSDTLENVLAIVPNNMRSGPFGSALLKSELVENGIPFLGIDNIHTERFVSNYKRFVSERKFNELKKYAVRRKDVVITIMGTVGRSAVIPENIEKALSSKHLWTMTFDTELVIPELICWQLNFAPWVKSWFRRETQGGIMDAIQSKTLKKLKIPIPPINEQHAIFERYSAITNKIESESDKFSKYNKIKMGLMHDLLTGKKTVSLESAEAACV
jgi:type I restriction enzyme S subunit